jgi:hypothetical protein
MDQPEATVVTSSLAAFIPGVSVEQRRAVKLAAWWAESTTFKSMAGESHQQQYAFYRRQLQYLGWDALSAQDVHWPDPQRAVITEQALKRIGALAGEQHASSMALALRALRKSGPPLLHFESHCGQRGRFQLLSCAPVSPNYVDMVLYHEAGETETFSAGFLFRERHNTQVHAQLVRFNCRLFEQEHRSKVERALAGIGLKDVHELAL